SRCYVWFHGFAVRIAAGHAISENSIWYLSTERLSCRNPVVQSIRHVSGVVGFTSFCLLPLLRGGGGTASKRVASRPARPLPGLEGCVGHLAGRCRCGLHRQNNVR